MGAKGSRVSHTTTINLEKKVGFNKREETTLRIHGDAAGVAELSAYLDRCWNGTFIFACVSVEQHVEKATFEEIQSIHQNAKALFEKMRERNLFLIVTIERTNTPNQFLQTLVSALKYLAKERELVGTRFYRRVFLNFVNPGAMCYPSNISLDTVANSDDGQDYLNYMLPANY